MNERKCLRAAPAAADSPSMVVAATPRTPDVHGLVSHHYVEANGIRMHVAEAGRGEPILFFHGFPENWYSWRNQYRGLRKGFRVIGADVRGFGLSRAKSGFDAEHVRGDILGLLDGLGIERANLVGHDWGGLLLWHFIFRHPERVNRVAMINTPHLLAYPASMLGEPTHRLLMRALRYPQMLWLPALRMKRLPEALFQLAPERVLRILFEASAYGNRLPMTLTELHYMAMLYSRPDAWRGPLAYYQNSRRSAAQCRNDLKGSVLERPVLMLMGAHDPMLRPSFVDPMRTNLPDLTVHQVQKAGHWTHTEQPDEVNRALAGFFG